MACVVGRLLHQTRKILEMGLSVLVVPEPEEVSPVGRRDEDVDPHKGLEEPIANLLVVAGVGESFGMVGSNICSRTPHIFSLPQIIRFSGYVPA